MSFKAKIVGQVDKFTKSTSKKPKVVEVVKPKPTLFKRVFKKGRKDIDDRDKVTNPTEALREIAKACPDDVKDVHSRAFVSHYQVEERPVIKRVEGLPFPKKVEALHENKEKPAADKVRTEILAPTTISQEHPNGISGLAYALLCILSNSLLGPSRSPGESTRLDLYPLYGPADKVKNIRLLDGSGKMSPDTFWDDDPCMTPATATLLILLNRYHNFAAERVFQERSETEGWKVEHEYVDVDSEAVFGADDDALPQDTKIFDIARSITCIYFKNVVMSDLLKGILGVSHIGGDLSLNIHAELPHETPQGEYQLGLESALLFDWSKLITKDDALYISRVLRDIGSHTDTKIILENVKRYQSSNSFDRRRNRRDVAGLRRNVDGTFSDHDLVRILQAATKTPAGEINTANLSGVLSFFQAERMDQGRKWDACTFNDYRRSLGLKPLQSFAEWNSDSEIAGAAEKLYGNIEDLELYPGLCAEEKIQGDGFQLGHTQSRGLGVELLSIVRKDERFTAGNNAAKLTTWGYEECNNLNKDNVRRDFGSFGGLLPKVLFRILPLYYPFASVWSLFPLVTPTKSQELIEQCLPKEEAGSYLYKQPICNIKTINSEGAIKEVLSRPEVFAFPHAENMEAITNGYGYLLGFDDSKLHAKDLYLTMYSLLPDKGALERYRKYYQRTLAEILNESFANEMSSGVDSKPSVDLVYVINKAGLKWVVDHLLGSGQFINTPTSEKEVKQYMEKLTKLYLFANGLVESRDGWEARKDITAIYEDLRKQVDRNLAYSPLTASTSYLERAENMSIAFWRRVMRIFLEFSIGRKVQPSAQTFLHRTFRLASSLGIESLVGTVPHLKRLLDQLTEEHAASLTEFERRHMPTRSAKAKPRAMDDLERRRMIANVCGFVLVSAATMSRVANLLVAYFLHPERKVQREKLIELCQKEAKSGLDDEERQLLRMHILEAQRRCQSFRLARVAKEDFELKDGTRIAAGTRIDLALTEAHNEFGGFNPFRNPEDIPETLGGYGLHRCPALGYYNTQKKEYITGYLETILSEIFVAVFSTVSISQEAQIEISPLRNTPVSIKTTLNRDSVMNYLKRGKPWQKHTARPEEKEKSSPQPEKLSPYKEFFFRRIQGRILGIWEDINKTSTMKGKKKSVLFMHFISVILGIVLFLQAISMIRWFVWLSWGIIKAVRTVQRPPRGDIFMTVISASAAVVQWSFWLVWAIVKAVTPSISLTAPAKPTFSPQARVVEQVQSVAVDCPAPHIVYIPWTVASFNLTEHNTPTEIMYEMHTKEPHLLAVLGIGKRDTRMSIYVDDVLRGETNRVEVNKEMDCGGELEAGHVFEEEWPKYIAECMSMGYSIGQTPIEGGDHLIKIKYAGDEFVGDQNVVDWHGETQRKVLMRVQRCSAQ